MRTGVYIDGFNLYYGCLQRSPYKWLDLQKFATSLLEAEESLAVLKYFTAKVEGNSSSARQQVYLRAVENQCPMLQVFYGYYLKTTTNMQPVNPIYADPSLNGKVEVHKQEEKGSDVNLAIHMLDDAWRGNIDRVLLVTNDGDLRDAIKLVRHRYNDLRIKVGVAAPLSNGRKISRVLKRASDFRRNIETSKNLANCQMPDQIPNTNIKKPNHWA